MARTATREPSAIILAALISGWSLDQLEFCLGSRYYVCIYVTVYAWWGSNYGISDFDSIRFFSITYAILKTSCTLSLALLSSPFSYQGFTLQR